jgi:hypothetical protein
MHSIALSLLSLKDGGWLSLMAQVVSYWLSNVFSRTAYSCYV